MKLSILLSIAAVAVSTHAHSQTNSSGPGGWPSNPPVGIGTQLSGGPVNALHVHYTPAQTIPAIFRLSEGTNTSSSAFGVLGLMPIGTTTYSTLSKGQDLILHENEGDLILTNYWAHTGGGAIRMATTPDTTLLPIPGVGVPSAHTDLERMTILSNGNIGIAMPPDATTGLCIPRDQIEIGGGIAAYPGNPYPTPGLTIYGGNRFENLLSPLGGNLPGDWRYISFNHYVDHTDPGPRRSHRMQPVGSSQIGFADADGGMLDFTTMPFDNAMTLDSAMRDFGGGMSMHMTSNGGLFVWCDETKNGGIQYHHLMDLFRPGVTPWPVSRNTNGLFVHHTPVLITSDSTSTPSIDFTRLANLHPNIGDGDTWYLAVNGPALFKEVFVNSNDWPDYVFQPQYELRTIDEFGAYIRLNHHLPNVPAAKDMNGARSLGKTQEALTKQVEEMALYIVQLNTAVEELRKEVARLKSEKGE